MNASNPALRFGTGRESWRSILEMAVREVFELMLACSLETPAGPPSGSSLGSSLEETLDVAATVRLTGQLSGMLTMRCRTRAAAQMASRMLGVELDAELNKAKSDMWDAAGEICNMVAGNFKNKISGLGDGCVLSVPTVIAGSSYRRYAIADEEICTAMLFLGEPLVFSLEIHG